MNPIKISVVIITFNEENNIRRCLESVKDIADEIVVLDSYSSDHTAKICREYNVKFVQKAFAGHIEQKNAAIEYAYFDYVLSLDADESLSIQLFNSIKEIKVDARHEAYIFNRLTYYGGQTIKTCGWYPDSKIRLWNKYKGQWVGVNPHDKVQIDKSVKVKFLEGDLLHYSFTDFWDYINRQIKYAKISGEAYFKTNKTFPLIKIFINPLFRFFRDFIIKLGFTDGLKGLMISLVSSFAVFVKYYTYYVIRKNAKLPSCSLIISTYNWPEALELVLMSVVQQTHLPDEVIIADDGSGSKTKKVIEKYEKLIPNLLHCRHKDDGFRLAEIRNKAIKKATKDIIIQIDGDTILHSKFVYDHKKFIKKGFYTQGSRTLMGKEIATEALKSKKINFSFSDKGLGNRFNALYIPKFGKFVSNLKTNLSGLRGCNMAFWRVDLLKINGYNQDIKGWGKEDTELVARLYNIGIKRKNLKFAGIQYHIFHYQKSRANLFPNLKILNNTIENNLKWCNNGIVNSLNPSP